jgi:hypothetical protein
MAVKYRGSHSFGAIGLPTKRNIRQIITLLPRSQMFVLQRRRPRRDP